MSTSTTYVTAGFNLLIVSALDTATVRVSFTYDPVQSDPTGAHDALNSANYTISGSAPVVIASVNTVTGDPSSVDLYLVAPLVNGVWTLTASTAIQLPDSTSLNSPNVLSFTVSLITTSDPVNGGTVSDTPEDIIRKHLPSSFVGPAWDAVIAGLASGDQTNIDNARLVFDQLFNSSASGVYLARRGGEFGITAPPAVGMSDDTFRSYLINSTTGKLTAEAVLDILEVFYGEDATRAHIESVDGPYALVDGQYLTIETSNQSLVLTFHTDEFYQTGLASAVEVVASINRQALAQMFPILAKVTVNPTTQRDRVSIYSQAKGLEAKLVVRNGTAQKALAFPELIPATTLAPGVNISITIPQPGTTRFIVLNTMDTPLLQVVTGDYVNVLSNAFAQENQGSFAVSNVSVTWNGASWTQFFDVMTNGLAQTGPIVIASSKDIQFFRPLAVSIANGNRSVILSEYGTTDVVLPATTQAVNRDDGIAAYLPGDPLVLTAPTGLWNGPFIFSPASGSGLSSIEGSLVTPITAGHQYQSLTISGASDIPDASGYLAFAFGTSQETLPVKYLGKISDTELIIDFSYIWPHDIAAGRKVTWLFQKGPYSPAPEAGAFYLTDSAVGRVAAQAAIEATVAAGADINVTVVYPGDKGLGNAGYPDVGDKVSDIVRIFGE